MLAGTLLSHLYLANNCRVMLRRNINVARGLVNGSLGTVRQIIYRADQRPPELPALILVEPGQLMSIQLIQPN